LSERGFLVLVGTARGFSLLLVLETQDGCLESLPVSKSGNGPDTSKADCVLAAAAEIEKSEETIFPQDLGPVIRALVP
jgi:hypothetical protein